MATRPGFIPIGETGEFLDSVQVDTPAGNDLHRETVVFADPENPLGLAKVTNTTPASDAYGGVVRVAGQIIAAQASPYAVTQSGAWTVSINNFPANQTVSGTVELGATTLTALESVSVQNTVTVQATDLDIRNLSSAQDSVNVGNFPATQAVSGSVSVDNFPATQQIKDSTDLEYTSVATTVTNLGDTTLYTPAAGKRVRLHWIYAVNDPTAAIVSKLTIKIGANTYYVAWDIMKRQQFTGPINGALAINLSAAGNVAVTAFVEEV